MNTFLRTASLRRTVRSGFTLTELLAVITIMGIMVLAMAPAFTKIGEASKLSSAVLPLQATLRQAREYAISNNHPIQVVFPHHTGTAPGAAPMARIYMNQSLKQRMLRSYAVYSSRDGYISDWKFLPRGVIFNPEHATSHNVLTRRDTQVSISYPNFKVGASPGPALPMQCITFRPDGTVKANGNEARIYLVQGITTADADPAPGSLDYEITDDKVMMALKVRTLTGSIGQSEIIQ